ncbi:MAG: hypothetical protein IKW08_08255 [Roseburia sp.]|nr:hypothetical protein [Roseburia sp.]
MQEKSHESKWSVWVMIALFICLFIYGAVIIYVDPFFHYHAPIKGISYSLERDNERYQNWGILSHFSYDTIIIGTSLTENFKPSEWEALMGGTVVKTPLAGGTYKEMNDHLKRAFSSSNEIKMVIRALDIQCLIYDKDAMMENYVFPTYMTNDNLLDDVYYVFNKDVMKWSITALQNTAKGYPMTSFDEYANWMPETYYGKENVLLTYKLGEPETSERELTQEEILTIKENVRQNVTELIEAYPETTFYLFIPPYSICYWDEIVNKGELSYWLAAERVLVEELLKYSNIKLYSFENIFEVICNLDNYKDTVHYGEWINTEILQWMAEEQYLLTEENYMDYFKEMEEFLQVYDYTIFH